MYRLTTYKWKKCEHNAHKEGTTFDLTGDLCCGWKKEARHLGAIIRACQPYSTLGTVSPSGAENNQ